MHLEKDYEYLLHRLVPHRHLPPEQRKRIEDALRGGRPDDIRREAVLALEYLRGEAYLRRSAVESLGQETVVTYARPSGRFRFRLQIPTNEWESWVSADQRPVATPALPRAEAVEGTTIDILPNILKTLSINDRRESTLERLERVMGLLSGWLQLVGARLLLVEERVGEPAEAGAFVAVAAERTVVKRAIYERCRRSKAPEVLGRAAARALGIPEPVGRGGKGKDAQVVVAPVHSMEEFWGILEVWVPADLDETAAAARARVVLGMVEQIIENALKLENLTAVDKITGIYNRQFYEIQIQIEIERATRSGTKLSMLVIDIDDFKKINDTYGHRAGDEALGLVGRLIKRNLRKIDLAFRYGGEEFVVLLPGTAQVEAIHTAERLRAVIAESEGIGNGDPDCTPITVSVGGAVFPEHGRTEEDLFSRADAALYRAKRRGKNRVEFYDG